MAKPRFSCSKTEIMVELLHCNPRLLVHGFWIPAFAGMTEVVQRSPCAEIPHGPWSPRARMKKQSV